MTGIETGDIQPSAAYVQRHDIGFVRTKIGARALTFTLFFSDGMRLEVAIFAKRKDVNRAMQVHCRTKKEVEAFFSSPEGDVGYLGFSRQHLDDVTVVHEMIHATTWWMLRHQYTPAQISEVLSHKKRSAHEIFADEVGEMVQQFWQCYSIYYRRKRPWEPK